jgi:hypothetical protein
LRAGAQDGHLDAGADFLDGLVGGLTLNRLVLRVDGVELAFVTLIQDVLEDDVADRVLAIGCADDGDRFRFEQRGQIVLFQHLMALPGCYCASHDSGTNTKGLP